VETEKGENMRLVRTQTRYCRRGFTLVELMIVVAIIGVLATLVITRYAGKTDQAKAAAGKAHIQQLETAIIEFQAHCGRIPSSLEELVTKPGDCPNWQDGGYLKGNRVPKDPWGREYVYRGEGSKYEIVSLAADGRQGGSGVDADISSNNTDGAAK
jgi:general secretion pathway protein G